jgi:hypothetical protein
VRRLAGSATARPRSHGHAADENCLSALDSDFKEADGPAHTLAGSKVDADAAVRQPAQAHQPAGTAIYFGIDFNAGADTAPAVLGISGPSARS